MANWLLKNNCEKESIASFWKPLVNIFEITKLDYTVISVHTLKILLSNLSMFIITSLLYIKSRTKIEEKSHETDITNNTKQNGHQSIDSIAPSSFNRWICY